MNKRVPIAEIKLAPGEAGYYDEYSRIYLSSYHPSAVVYSGTNCTQIKKSIKSGRLRLVRGGFETPESIEETTPVVIPEIKEEVLEHEVQEDLKKEEIVVEETKEETPTVSEIQEEITIVVPEEESQQEEVKVVKEEAKTNKRKSRKATKVEE